MRSIDDTIGQRVDAATRHHHRRRLDRIGWGSIFEPEPGAWARAEPPPRAGNHVEVMVDGAEALPAIAAAIASARSSVYLAGWYFSPDFQPEKRGHTLRELLAEAAERVDVRVLAWAGSPLRLFQPDRREVRETIERLTGGTRIRSALDARERPMHCHHEKLVIVDGERAFVGGLDLTTLQGDRYDTSDHAARGSKGWHDASALLRGPAVSDVADHFAMRWNEVTGEPLPSVTPSPPAGTHDVQVVRTVPERIYDALPNGDFRIAESYFSALADAQQLVYIESQFLWSPEIVALLAHKLAHPPSDEFRVVVLLPARPNNGREDTRGQLGVLVDADDGHRRFLASTLYQRGTSPAEGVYVHAKIAIVDDRWLTIGSANLNEHSLFNDTEMNLAIADSELARSVRLRLWAEHLECDVSELTGPVHEIVDEFWRPRAEQGYEEVRTGRPPTHRLARLGHVSRRTGALLGPLNGLLVDG